MAGKPQDRVTKLIKELAPIWQTRLGLDHWEIEHVYLDAYYTDDNGEDFKVTATTESRWQYMQGIIKWYLPSAVRHDDQTLEKVLVHELVHILLAPEQTLIDTEIVHTSAHGNYTETQSNALSERNYEHIELATEMTTKALLNAYNEN